MPIAKEQMRECSNRREVDKATGLQRSKPLVRAMRRMQAMQRPLRMQVTKRDPGGRVCGSALKCLELSHSNSRHSCDMQGSKDTHSLELESSWWA